MTEQRLPICAILSLGFTQIIRYGTFYSLYRCVSLFR